METHSGLDYYRDCESITFKLKVVDHAMCVVPTCTADLEDALGLDYSNGRET